MPIYEYRCTSCDKVNEVLQKMSDPAPTECPSCGKGPMEKLMSQTGFVLKGSGWYVTDFKGGSKPKPEGGKEAPKSEVSAAPETKKPESSPKS